MADQYPTDSRVLHNIRAAIAETAQKTTETSGNGNRESHPRASKDGVVPIETSRLAEAPQEPGTSSPNNAERPDRAKR